MVFFILTRTRRDGMDAASLPTETLAERCADETHRFVHRQSTDPQFCFELIRRALTDSTSDAFTQVYRIYEPLIRQWVHKHPGFESTGEEADFFVQQAVTNFYFALRGDKFDGFDELSAVLKYLKMCIHSAIVQYLRSQTFTVPVLEEHLEVPETHSNLHNHIQTLEIWERITQLLPEERDLRLAFNAFSLWLKPNDIAEEYPDEWPDARSVTVALYRIRTILRRDKRLRDLLGVSGRDPSNTVKH